ncbi:hypothetical protein T492DRAFT_845172 [Pavlovales sp. CCMP2436]|nr:hypothetical protein T492DRAFT_845172 [Pavlovales sp. CCMP2436]
MADDLLIDLGEHASPGSAQGEAGALASPVSMANTPGSVQDDLLAAFGESSPGPAGAGLGESGSQRAFGGFGDAAAQGPDPFAELLDASRTPDARAYPDADSEEKLASGARPVGGDAHLGSASRARDARSGFGLQRPAFDEAEEVGSDEGGDEEDSHTGARGARAGFGVEPRMSLGRAARDDLTMAENGSGSGTEEAAPASGGDGRQIDREDDDYGDDGFEEEEEGGSREEQEQRVASKIDSRRNSAKIWAASSGLSLRPLSLSRTPGLAHDEAEELSLQLVF